MAKSEIPHSWPLGGWTEEAPRVYPNTTERARYLVRTHIVALLKAGAVSRVGRELVIIGDRYARWLEKQSTAVPGFVPNTRRAADSAASAESQSAA